MCEIMKKVAACFGPAVRVIQAVVLDHVTGRPFSSSARHQRTCNHACKQAAHQTSLQRRSKECTFCVQGWRYRCWSRRACEQWADLLLGQDVQTVLSPFSRWSAPLSRDVPPDFLVKSEHIYGDSVRDCSGSGGSGIVGRDYLWTYLIWG
jgi:hypothetical protein